MHSRTHPVTRASAADATAVDRTLAAAFADDPVFAWLLPDRARRAAVLQPSFAAFRAAFARHDRTYRTGDGASTTGAALWAPPGHAPVHPDDEGTLLELHVDLLTDDELERFGACMAVFEAAHPSAPAWFLQFVGVDPAHQGQGLGSALLDHVLAEADWRGEAAYLEATSPRNRALYERHGFRCIGDLVLPGGPTCWAMWRDPWAAPVR